jgi:carbonic anhydrase
MPTCRALVIHCMDFRLGKAVKTYLEDKGLLDDSDELSLAGASRSLVRPTSQGESEFLLKQIGLASTLHKVREVFLVHHTDCGAYGGRAAFPDEDAESRCHVDDMRAAAALIRESFPDVIVRMVLLRIQPEGSIVPEEHGSIG